MSKKTRYGIGVFILDLLLIAITGGLWLIYMIIREWRRNS